MLAFLAAAIIPGAIAIQSDGLGDDGQAGKGPWFIGGQTHVFLVTGSNPENYGTFTLNLPLSLLGEVSSGIIARPVCTISPSWTNPDYAAGLATPRWPPVFLWQDAYDLHTFTVTFGWAVWGPPLQPNANYSINIVCPPKVTGFTGAP